MLIYNCPEVYDLFFKDDFTEASKKFFNQIFHNKKIKTILDCAVGTGQFAIPLAELGFNITGTDVNSHMIKKARQNFASKNLIADLQILNFFNLNEKLNRKYDCVMCTGNSLAQIEKEKLPLLIQQMKSVLKPGGYIYLDSRNWDLIMKRRQRFYLYNPIIRDRGRINLTEVWDYQKNNEKMVFNYLISEEVQNKIVSKRQFYAIFYPFKLEFLQGVLANQNFQNVNIFKLGEPESRNIETLNWYSIIARKGVGEDKKKVEKKGLLSKILG